MTAELALRLIGMVVCTLLGARIGAEISGGLPPEVFVLSFALVGSLTGLILTPYVTTRPARAVRRIIREMPAEALVTSIIGLIIGLIMAALFAVPLGLLPQPLGQWAPSIVAIVAAYVSIMVFAYRWEDVYQMALRILHRESPVVTEPTTAESAASEYPILMDSSAIIDGRILDISKTGFITGQFIVPNFILNELQHIADESNPQRRARGRRGLEILEQMQKEPRVSIEVMDVSVDGVREADAKLIVLAKQMNARLLTTDHNLKKAASLQGVQVLSVTDLANVVKLVYLPGDVITLHIIAEGREPGQGVGYLIDGTMVVVEDGKRHVDRTVDVIITRAIQTSGGKMYFARLEDNPRK